MTDRERLRTSVRRAYSGVAQRPDGEHPFAVGAEFAGALGYAPDFLARAPRAAVEAFTGVSNVPQMASIARGATVLDMGCGAGLDALMAAERSGPTGRVIGLDFSAAMLARAQQAAREAGQQHVAFVMAAAEAVPLASGSVDVALVNGLFNLNPARAEILKELARVLRPGGELYAAELILANTPESMAAPAGPDDWFK